MILETTLFNDTHTQCKLKKTDEMRDAERTTKRRGVENDDNDLRDRVKKG